MLHGQFRGISEMKMMDCLVRLGRTVKIVLGPEGEAADERIEVVAAWRRNAGPSTPFASLRLLRMTVYVRFMLSRVPKMESEACGRLF
jgi:hypothetical protein